MIAGNGQAESILVIMESSLVGAPDRNPEIQRILERISKETGADHGTSTYRRVERSVEKRMMALGISDIYAYIRLLDRYVDELDNLIEKTLVHETYFFRHKLLWQELGERFLKTLYAKNRGRKLRMWSAGCSTGEEAYTLGIVANEALPADSYEIVATDISTNVLREAKSATYGGRTLKQVSPKLLNRYFGSDKGPSNSFLLDHKIRDNVRFYKQNLVRDPIPPPGQFDLILCRHVLMYMDEDSANSVVDTFTRALRQDGTLILTAVEALLPPPQSLAIFPTSGGSAYHLSAAPPPVVFPAAPETEPKVTRREPQKFHAPKRRREEPPKVSAKAPEVSTERIDRFLRQSIIAADRGEYDQAYDKVSEALDMDPMLAEGHFLVGLLAERQGNEKQAITAFRRALYCDRSMSLAHFHLGFVLESIGQRRGAALSFSRAEKELPNNFEQWSRLAGSTQVNDLLHVCRNKIERLSGKAKERSGMRRRKPPNRGGAR